MYINRFDIQKKVIKRDLNHMHIYIYMYIWLKSRLHKKDLMSILLIYTTALYNLEKHCLNKYCALMRT